MTPLQLLLYLGPEAPIVLITPEYSGETSFLTKIIVHIKPAVSHILYKNLCYYLFLTCIKYYIEKSAICPKSHP